MIESRTVGAAAINNYPNRFLDFAQCVGTAQYYLTGFWNVNHKFAPPKWRSMETLAEYVQRVMAEKGLKAGGVAKRSKGGIGDSHVTNIANGTTTNLTVDTIKALALGLGVDPIEVCRAAIGAETDLTITTVARLLDKLLTDPNLSRLLVLIDLMDENQTKALRVAAEKILK